ncbi:MAG: tetratricopeptide repeat protein [Proteobacteria bacterium]|nr:tetratricopeptide repeat protein [Pseudomonadota bacterium]
MKMTAGVLALSGLLAGCSLLSPPQGMGGYPQPQERAAPPARASGSNAAVPAAQPAPFQGSPAQPQPPAAPMQRQFSLGPAATALVGEAHAQEHSRDFGLAAQTLERALSIEPRDPLVWIELGRENILAGNPAQAYGMGRKALYLASGDPHTQARAWQLIAASLREQGRNSEAYAAEEKAAAISQN